MAVETLRPNAAGDECNIMKEAGAACPNHYQNVDESSADDDTTKVYSNQTSYERDLYNITDHSVGSGTINKITVYARANDTYTGDPVRASLKICIKSGTGSGAPDTVSESNEITVSHTWTTYSNEWSTNPATGSAWTWDEIDKLQIGCALQYGYWYTQVTQVYVEVDYTAITEKTSSDSGSGSDARLSGSPLALMSKADSGSGVEGTPAPEATLTGSETGSGIEKLCEVILSDAGSGFENSHLDIVMSAKSSSDAGSGAEESGLLATFEQGETGSGNESLLSRVLSQPDSGGGSEATSALLAALINTETGSGIDLALSRLMITSETGSGVEKLPKREVLLSDAASGIETATVLKALLATDSGAGLEALVGLRALITNEEAGYGSERLGVRIMTATGTSNMKLLDKKGKARIPSRKVDL